LNESANLDYGAFPSLKRRGGRDLNKMDPFRWGADGAVSSGKPCRPEDAAELTTPSAALRWLRNFLLMPQPPLLFKEGNMARLQFIHTFTNRAYN
jgi:hypothetical protein